MTPANDNNAPPQGEKVICNTLANRVVIEHHMSGGLQVLLQHAGVSAKVRRAVAEYVSPGLAILDRIEADIIDYVRGAAPKEVPPPKAKDLDGPEIDW
jgi:hypothetical protein